MPFKVVIDRDQCISDMACVATCPDIFEMSEEDGKAQITEQYRIDGNIGEGKIPDDLEECARTAAEACPMGIISVEKIE